MNTKKAGDCSPAFYSRQRPTFPPSSPGSIIGAGGLNFRVRNGSGCFPSAMATGRPFSLGKHPAMKPLRSSPRPISTPRLKVLPPFHLGPINRVIFPGSYLVDPVGYLILGWASRLDAFSAYPIRTQLPSDAPGRTTGTLEVRPSRSSRTRDSSPQVSCARDR